MKIAINTPLKSDDIINLLNNYNDNGISFKFIKKTGIKLEFEVVGICDEGVCSLIKNLIKDTSFGKALYFSVVEV